jgi:hypothetical protein
MSDDTPKPQTPLSPSQRHDLAMQLVEKARPMPDGFGRRLYLHRARTLFLLNRAVGYVPDRPSGGAVDVRR